MKGRLNDERVGAVLYEGDGSVPLEADRRLATLRALLDGGHPVTRVAETGGTAPPDASRRLVFGQFDAAPPEPRSGVRGGEMQFVEAAELSVDDVVRRVEQEIADRGAVDPGGWKPWFPVIDYGQCTNCMQCLTFCLFDVYGVDGEKVIQVQNQDNCKTDCPACSRVCPEAAIMFPKYKAGPINGAELKPEDLQREAMKVDVSALLGGDIYGALRDRSTKARERFSTERDESKALLERKRCLAKLQKDLDIPDEVLMTLPSVGDIEERAARAKAKAERREQRSQSVKDRRSTQERPSEEDWGI